MTGLLDTTGVTGLLNTTGVTSLLDATGTTGLLDTTGVMGTFIDTVGATVALESGQAGVGGVISNGYPDRFEAGSTTSGSSSPLWPLFSSNMVGGES